MCTLVKGNLMESNNAFTAAGKTEERKKGDTEDFQGIRTIDFTPNEIS